MLTGRRRSEVIGLKAGDITFEGGTRLLHLPRQGREAGRRELPRPAFEAIVRGAGRRREDARDHGAGRVAVAGGRRRPRHDQRHLLRPPPRYLRGGWPAARRRPHPAPLGGQAAADAGESVEEVSRFLDHSSLAVTTVYLRRLEGVEDRSWEKVAEAIGV